MRRCLALIVAVVLCSFVSADEPVDLEAVNKIRFQGFHRSQVMDVARHISDVIGPRVTGSPQHRVANDWTCSKL